MPSESVFHRPAYAADMAQQLLKPTALQLQVRSGVFLSGIRRIGKTTFLRQDLIPALESRGALVVYVDLWADRSKNPASLVHEAVKAVLTDMTSPGSRLLERLFKSTPPTALIIDETPRVIAALAFLARHGIKVVAISVDGGPIPGFAAWLLAEPDLAALPGLRRPALAASSGAIDGEGGSDRSHPQANRMASPRESTKAKLRRSSISTTEAPVRCVVQRTAF